MHISTIVGLLVPIGMILYIRSIRSYLDNIESCPCVSEQAKGVAEKIRSIERIFLSLQYVSLVAHVLLAIQPSFIYKNILFGPLRNIFAIVFSVWMFIINCVNIAFLYYVYEFHKLLQPSAAKRGTSIVPQNECDCADKTPKDLLYVQAGAVAVSFGILVVSSISLASLYMRKK
jgi:hypothetical protein